MRTCALVPLLLVSLAAPTRAELDGKKAAGSMTAEEIQHCVQENFPDDSMVQTLDMILKDRTGVERLLEADLFWQKDDSTKLSRVLLTFDNPPDLRSASILVIEKKPTNDMFMYLPELKKVRRITSQTVNGNMMGTDFTYEDFMRVQGMVGNFDLERAADEQVTDRSSFVTVSRAKPGTESDYESIRSLVDQETCVPLRVEFFKKELPEPVKILTVDPKKIDSVESGWMPSELHMQDLRRGTSTTVVVQKIEVGVPIPKKIFTQTEMERHGRFGAPVKRY